MASAVPVRSYMRNNGARSPGHGIAVVRHHVAPPSPSKVRPIMARAAASAFLVLGLAALAASAAPPAARAEASTGAAPTAPQLAR